MKLNLLINSLLLLALLSAIALPLKAQEVMCDCKKDLDFVYKSLADAKSYKTQIKGAQKKQFKEKYEQLQAEIKEGIPVYECYQKLVSLVDEIKDNHLFIRGTTESFASEKLQDKAFMKTFRESPDFRIIPNLKLNLDSLKRTLKKEKRDAVAGIYAYRNLLQIGIFKTDLPKHYLGVVLSSKVSSWQEGDQILYLEELGQDHNFKAITGRLLNRRLSHYPDLFRDGQFLRLGFQKDAEKEIFFSQTLSEETFSLQRIDEQTQYLKLGSFRSFGENLKAADAFHHEIQGKLDAPNLILDLRNNTGGGDRASKQFLDLIKAYLKVKDRKVYVLINYLSISNTELFTLKLLKLDRITLLGDRSNGTLSYGINKAGSPKSPSGFFQLVLTDMNLSKHLPYENVGIEPAIKLDYRKDWIKQTLDIIEQN